jgi:hypothetical protein
LDQAMVSVPTYPTPTTLPSRGAFDYNGMPGVDPSQLRWQMLSQALSGLGSGLLSGNNWSSGLAAGFGGASRGIADARANATDEALRKIKFQQYQDEQARQAAEDARKAHLAQAVQSFQAAPGSAALPIDPNILQYLTPDQQFEALQSATKATAPYTDVAKAAADLRAGRISQAEYDQIKRKETYIAPQQPRQLTPYQDWVHQFQVDNGRAPNAKERRDYSRNPDRGGLPTGYQYNPDTGQAEAIPGLPKEALGGTPNKSAVEERAAQLRAAGYAEKDIPALASGQDPATIQAYMPVAPPKTAEGQIDPAQLDPNTRYRMPDGQIYLWDGSNFVPYE